MTFASKLTQWFREDKERLSDREEIRFFREFRKLKKLNVMIAIFATALFAFAPLLGTQTIRTIPDEFGPFILGATLAGNDWSYVAAYIAETYGFFGQGYYALFAPVWMLTDNPYTIWTALTVGNAIVVTLLAMLIYAVAIIYCKLPDKWYIALAVTLCANIILEIPHRPNNETGVYLIVWLAALMLFISSSSIGKKRVFATLGLLLVLLWGVFIHGRLEALLLVIAIGAILYFLLFKVWIVNPFAFYPGLAVTYITTFFVNARVLSPVAFADEVVAEMHDATITGEIVQMAQAGTEHSIRIFISIIASNATRLMTVSQGVAVLTVAIFAILLFRILKRVLIERKRTDLSLGLERQQLVVMLTFAICVIGIIVGTYFRARLNVMGIFFPSEEFAWATSSRWLAYSRYYMPFFSPLILITLSYLHRNSKPASKIVIAAYVIFLMLYFFTSRFIVPLIAHLSDFQWLNFDIGFSLWPFLPAIGLGGIAFITALFVLFYIIAYRKDGKKAVLILLPLIFMNIFSISGYAFNMIRHNGLTINSTGHHESNVRYSIIRHIEHDVGIPDTIYVADPMRLSDVQFMHSRKTAKPGFPADDESDAIIVGPFHYWIRLPLDESPMAEELIEQGFVYFEFFDDHYSRGLWIRGDEMIRSAKIYFEMHR